MTPRVAPGLTPTLGRNGNTGSGGHSTAGDYWDFAGGSGGGDTNAGAGTVWDYQVPDYIHSAPDQSAFYDSPAYGAGLNNGAGAAPWNGSQESPFDPAGGSIDTGTSRIMGSSGTPGRRAIGSPVASPAGSATAPVPASATAAAGAALAGFDPWTLVAVAMVGLVLFLAFRRKG